MRVRLRWRGLRVLRLRGRMRNVTLGRPLWGCWLGRRRGPVVKMGLS